MRADSIGVVTAFLGLLTAGVRIFDGMFKDSVKEGFKLAQEIVKLTPPPGMTFPAGQGITFMLTDELGTGQLAETAQISFSQLGFGTFNLNQQNQSAAINGLAPTPGFYPYKVSVTTEFASRKIYCTGEGSIFLVNGGRYQLNANYGNPCIAAFVPSN